MGGALRCARALARLARSERETRVALRSSLPTILFRARCRDSRSCCERTPVRTCSNTCDPDPDTNRHHSRLRGSRIPQRPTEVDASLAPLLFHDEALEADRARRDPVAPAQPSESVRRKKARRVDDNGLPLQSFQTLLAELGTRCRNSAHLKGDRSPTLQMVTDLSPLQARAFQLLGL